MKLIILAKYEDLAASTRQRLILYFPYYRSVGLEPQIAALFDNAYLRKSMVGQKVPFWHIVKLFIKRLRAIVFARDSAVRILHYEALPYFPFCVERLVFRADCPLVYDLDDAIYHRYDCHRSWIIRKLYGRKIDKVMAAADLVMAGNKYLADKARAAGARKVEVVPTIVDIDNYQIRPVENKDQTLKVGWVGSPSTWNEYLKPVLPLFADIVRAHGAELVVVGSGLKDADTACVRHLRWSEEEEVGLIQQMDIGIMPLTDTPWARGKCGYKLIQYMACGLPVVGSPVGVNAEIVEHGVNGFLASTEQEWREALATLLADPKLRRRMGVAGRRKVEDHYSLHIWGARVAELLSGVVEGRQTG